MVNEKLAREPEGAQQENVAPKEKAKGRFFVSNIIGTSHIIAS
jgi:hypothetical protein